jgi:WD40 repeat protein/tRNA A-37 threonylcarbamoyl transferase component Bud32
MPNPSREFADSLGRDYRNDALCDRFERGWLGAQAPSLSEYLETVPEEERKELLRELLPIEIHHRLQRNDHLSLEEYRARYPDIESEWFEQAVAQAQSSLHPRQLNKTAHFSLRRTLGMEESHADSGHEAIRIPGYEILGELGRGAMGVVYRARQVGLHRIVALKMILSGRYASASELARFKKEAAVMASLPHPNIVQVFDFNEHDGHLYFTCECIDGGTLANKISGVAQPPRDAARFLETLARAVHHAHQAGIVHRDLKPANILLTNNGVPKIVDFGLAKQTGSDQAATIQGVLIGTPMYMSPEQSLGQAERVGPTTDVYGLGAILYEMLTGRPPFQAANVQDVLKKIRISEPVAPRLIRRTIPRDLETICLKCLQKTPENRYSSAADLADDLQRFLSDRPIHARPVSRVETLWRWCKRYPKEACAALAAVLLLCTVTVTSLIFANSYSRISRQASLATMEAIGTRKQSEQQAMETNLQLAHALVNEARMLRRSKSAGQYFKSKERLLEAKKILTELEENGFTVDKQEWSTLRDEASSALLIPDLRESETWKASDPEYPHIFPCMARRMYMRIDPSSRGAALCRFGSDEPFASFSASPGSEIRSGDFSADGNYAWTLSTLDDRIEVWDIRDPQSPRKLESFPRGLHTCLSRDGSVLAVGRSPSQTDFYFLDDDREVVICREGAVPFGGPMHPSLPWCIVANSSRLAVYDYEKQEIVWSRPSDVLNAAWSADGRWLSTSSRRGFVASYSLRGDSLHPPLLLSDAGGVQVHPDSANDLLYTTDWSGNLQVLDPRTRQSYLTASRILDQHGRVSADGQSIGIGGNRERLWIYQPRRGRLKEFGIGSTQYAALSHSGRWLATSETTRIALYHLPSGERMAVLDPDLYGTVPLAFGVDDRSLFAYGNGVREIPLQFIDESRAEPVLRIGLPKGIHPFPNLDRWGTDSRLQVIAAPKYNQGTQILHRDPNQSDHWFEVSTPEQNDVRSIAVSPDGRWVVAGSHVKGSVSVYSATSGELHRELRREGGSTQFSPDGRWLAVAKFRGVVELFRVEDWESQGERPGSRGIFSSDGKLMAIGTKNGEIELLATDSFQRVALIEVPDRSAVFPVAFGTDGRALIAVPEGTRRSLYIDLAGLRSELKEMGLDWDWPDLPPDTSASEVIPKIIFEQAQE